VPQVVSTPCTYQVKKRFQNVPFKPNKCNVRRYAAVQTTCFGGITCAAPRLARELFSHKNSQSVSEEESCSLVDTTIE
jgi:hypothetical protein